MKSRTIPPTAAPRPGFTAAMPEVKVRELLEEPVEVDWDLRMGYFRIAGLNGDD